MTNKFSFLFLLILTVQISAQDFNKIIEDPKSGNPMLIGLLTPEAFTDSNFISWFNSSYELYEPDLRLLHPYIDELLKLRFVVVLGSWCEDSQFLVPQFMKILNEIGYPVEDLRLIAVDREKKTPNGDTDNLNIEFVPTIIIYKENTEIGRIVEYPEDSYEKDIINILNKDEEEPE
ncbi:MAG: hypothetical protein Kow0098_21980 [Ignavibacteriaceae bacterium]